MRFLLLIMIVFSTNLFSVEPDEILDDPKLETRAKQIGQQLRCLVCQNEDIQNSNADIAKDLRTLVRSLLLTNKSDEEIIDYVHQRYGDFVLFSPPVRSDTIALWLIPTVFFIMLFFIFLESHNDRFLFTHSYPNNFYFFLLNEEFW